jgi:hypothetical protein
VWRRELVVLGVSERLQERKELGEPNALFPFLSQEQSEQQQLQVASGP